MSTRAEIERRLLNGETLTASQIVEEYGVTPPVLFHAIRNVKDKGFGVQKDWMPDFPRGYYTYRVLPKAPGPPPSLEARVTRIERILSTHRLGEGLLLATTR